MSAPQTAPRGDANATARRATSTQRSDRPLCQECVGREGSGMRERRSEWRRWSTAGRWGGGAPSPAYRTASDARKKRRRTSHCDHGSLSQHSNRGPEESEGTSSMAEEAEKGKEGREGKEGKRSMEGREKAHWRRRRGRTVAEGGEAGKAERKKEERGALGSPSPPVEGEEVAGPDSKWRRRRGKSEDQSQATGDSQSAARMAVIKGSGHTELLWAALAWPMRGQ